MIFFNEIERRLLDQKYYPEKYEHIPWTEEIIKYEEDSSEEKDDEKKRKMSKESKLKKIKSNYK